MLKYILLGCLLQLTACTESTPVKPHTYEAFRFMSESQKNFKKQYNLNAFGVGGRLSGNIKELDMSFILKCERVYSIDEARELIVNCVEEVYLNVNNDECIRPYLENYPFDRNKLMISINFAGNDGRFFKNKQLASVNLNGDYVYYSSYTDELGFDTLYKETYEEALEIVRKQQENCL